MNDMNINFPNLNYGGTITPRDGAFTCAMLCAALGLGNRSEMLALGVRIGAIAAPDFKESENPQTWLWKPDTVQPLMTGAAATTVREALAAA